jgi:hypothetical protein
MIWSFSPEKQVSKLHLLIILITVSAKEADGDLVGYGDGEDFELETFKGMTNEQPKTLTRTGNFFHRIWSGSRFFRYSDDRFFFFSRWISKLDSWRILRKVSKIETILDLLGRGEEEELELETFNGRMSILCLRYWNSLPVHFDFVIERLQLRRVDPNSVFTGNFEWFTNVACSDMTRLCAEFASRAVYSVISKTSISLRLKFFPFNSVSLIWHYLNT